MATKIIPKATFKPGDPVCDALFQTRTALRNRDKQYTEGPIEVEAGWPSNSPTMFAIKDRLSRDLTKRFGETVDEKGRVSGNGVRSNWYGMRHVSGFGQIPATYPVADNTLQRAAAGLANHFVEPWHRNVLESLVELFFSDLEPEATRLRVGSSSMVPQYTKDMTTKIEIATTAMQSFDRSSKHVLAGDYTTAWTQFALGGCYHVVYRQQASDSISYEKGVWTPKVRKVATLEYALSGGAAGGDLVPASKDLTNVDFHVPDGFFRCRRRTAMGGPLGTNALLMPIAQPVRAKMFQSYPYTYHHTTRESIQSDIRETLFVIAADVTQHDQYWPCFVIDTIANTLLNMGFDPGWVAVYRMKFKLPTYVSDIGPGVDNVLIGDWRDPDMAIGLPSGNAFTDIEGALVMTWVYFLIMVEHTYASIIPSLKTRAGAKRQLEAFLNGKLPIRLKDKSDDALLMWADSSLVYKAEQLQAKMKDGVQVSPYMVVSYEHGGAFLGSILLYPESKKTSEVTLIGNIISFLVNRLSPEYGVQSMIKDRARCKRPYPGLAYGSLHQNYGTSPIFGEVKEMLERVYRDVTGDSYHAVQMAAQKRDEALLQQALRVMSQRLSLADLTQIDLEVLARPDTLEYKYDRRDVSDAVLNLLFKGVPLSVVEPFFKRVTGRSS